MFDFKYKEDIEQCFGCLEVKRIVQEDNSAISLKVKKTLWTVQPRR